MGHGKCQGRRLCHTSATWAMDVQPSGQVRAESDQAMWFTVQELAANNQADAWVLLPFLPRESVHHCRR